MDFRKRFLVIVNKYRCFFHLTDSQVAAEFLICVNNFDLVETLCKYKSCTIELARCADKLPITKEVSQQRENKKINVGQRAKNPLQTKRLTKAQHLSTINDELEIPLEMTLFRLGQSSRQGLRFLVKLLKSSRKRHTNSTWSRHLNLSTY